MSLTKLDHNTVFEAQASKVTKQKDKIKQIESQIVSLKVQLTYVERDLLKEEVRLSEMEKALLHTSGMVTALNDAFDEEVESAKQKGFEDGYSARELEEKEPNKPLPTSQGARKTRMDKKKK